MNKLITFLCFFLSLGSGLMAMDDLGAELRAAARIGNHEKVNSLIVHGAPIDARDEYNRTPLMYAAVHGHLGICALLLASNAQVNAKAPVGTPLSLAVDNNHIDICKLLLAHMAHVNAVCSVELTPLMMAAEHGNLDICRLLLAHDAQIDARATNGVTPLRWAANFGHPNVCHLLIDIMIHKRLKFEKNKRSIIAFLSMKKKSAPLKLVGPDIVRLIAGTGLKIIAPDNIDIVGQINTITNGFDRAKYTFYYHEKLSALQDDPVNEPFKIELMNYIKQKFN